MKIANHKGFTMVELLIVLAIIAILAAVAIPVYSSQLENSRREVDNSNLRAATGLAAQDYILRTSGTAGAGYNGWHYVVLTFENSASVAVKSQNMVVYPDNGVVDKDGNWHNNADQKGVDAAGGADKVALTIPNWYNMGRGTAITKTGMISGQTPKLFPLQQNGGNAKFVISIGTGGVVKESKIEIGKIADIT